jgi:hypothetical protein
MRKLAYFGIIIVFAMGLIIGAAVLSEDFRNSIANSVEGTIIAPIDVGVTNGWMDIGRSGFTFIALTAFLIYAFGIFSGYAWSHWLRPRITWGLPSTQEKVFEKEYAPKEPEPVKYPTKKTVEAEPS